MLEPGRLEAKLLYRRLDSLLGKLDPSRPQRRLLETFLEDAFEALKHDLQLKAALLFSERRDGFDLVKRVGASLAPVAETLAPTLPTLAAVLRHRVYIFSDPGDPAWPEAAGLPAGPGAALLVGRRPQRHLFYFVLAPGWVHEELDFALNTLRAALGSRLADERVRGRFREAAQIQQSLLAEEAPAFAGYEIACRSLPTEEVSGDFYDFYSFGDSEMLGLAIGDASGHGLPAALLVRDVVTGLRMGLGQDLRAEYVFGKLNRVIHRSALSSRFVSVFYGELEANGNLVYVNAGHQPPLLIQDGQVAELRRGGTVIGPLPEAEFRRGIVNLAPGALLVLTTDGLVERRGPGGEFGAEGLTRVARASSDAPAEKVVETLFAAAYEHGHGRPWEDDATLVVVKRLADPPGGA